MRAERQKFGCLPNSCILHALAFSEGCRLRDESSCYNVSCNLLCCPYRRYCEHNPNKGFASCNIPQELSNDEIDKQLADSEVRSLHLRAIVPKGMVSPYPPKSTF